MKLNWQEHDISVEGEFNRSYLFLVPRYSLSVDGTEVAVETLPRMRPSLSHEISTNTDGEDEGQTHTVEVEILSILGIRPRFDVLVDDEVVESGRLEVEGVFDHALVIFIAVSIMFMIWVGPTVLREYLGY